MRSAQFYRRGQRDLYGPEPPEAAFQQQVIELAKRQGWECYFTWSSINSPAGFPDLVMVRGPRVVFAELKRDSNQLSEDQRRWLWKLAAAGQEVYLWKPVAWKQIDRVILWPPGGRQVRMPSWGKGRGYVGR